MNSSGWLMSPMTPSFSVLFAICMFRSIFEIKKSIFKKVFLLQWVSLNYILNINGKSTSGENVTISYKYPPSWVLAYNLHHWQHQTAEEKVSFQTYIVLQMPKKIYIRTAVCVFPHNSLKNGRILMDKGSKYSEFLDLSGELLLES